VFVDAHATTRALFGDDQYANIFLVGVACQSGQLPVGPEAIEHAIALNGVAVETNLQAFRRGRQHVADPASLRSVLAERGTAPAPEPDRQVPLDELIKQRSAELVAYQNRAYADRYLSRVEMIRAAETRVAPGQSALTDAVARYLFKLMAYKDEYEVARLSRDPALARSIRDTFGDGARFSYRLHPPVLRALGMRRKMAVGPWFRYVFAVLHAMRRLRGTRLDPFGYARVRRLERELVAEYDSVIDELARTVTAASHALAVEIASAPDLVRGYEEVKLASVERYRARLSSLRQQLTAQAELVQ
jgi:indolepyruvate ferredoxin oxidoreductase